MSYKIVIVPFLALIIAQIIKVILDARKGEFSWGNLNRYGGMPSSHSAMVAALCVEIGMATGFNSAYFAIALAFSFLIVRDAVGLRRNLGKHGKILNMLIKDLPDYKENKYPFLEERLGHTYWQALVGILLGIIIALLI
ncbi:MAG TPA: divergent PAP2 family protein [Candidatus Uhrbacteria bacterium]|nr:divergent PAP2 family protein [Candidatus Uhrbacteria bacterium]